MAEGILLEAGTNEMELLVFRIKDTLFGINVAKIRELIQRSPTIAIPHSPREVEGSFKLRDEVLTLVNLGKYFEMEGEETQKGAGLIIIVEFNLMRCGVLVDAVEVIHRLKWDEIDPPSDYLAKMKAPITGVAQVDGKTVLVADFESIIGEVLGIPNASEPDEVEESEEAARAKVRILVVDDSSTIREKVVSLVNRAGFVNVVACSDGQQAWDLIQERRKEAEGRPFDLVLTDIEMPQMDGLHLTQRVKEDPELAKMAVVLFSSLISPDNIKKGNQVGADAQVTKLQGSELMEAIEGVLQKMGLLT